MSDYYEQTLKIIQAKKDKLTKIYLDEQNKNNNNILVEIEELDIKIIEYHNKIKEEKRKGK